MQPLQRSEYCLSNNIQELHFNSHQKNAQQEIIIPVQISTQGSIIFCLLNNKV